MGRVGLVQMLDSGITKICVYSVTAHQAPSLVGYQPKDQFML